MTTNKYETLQTAHQSLLQRQESGEAAQTLLNDVRAFIEQAKADAEFIASPRDRSQLRANLRFWAAYVFDQTKTYPDTTLRPARQADGPASAPTTLIAETAPRPPALSWLPQTPWKRWLTLGVALAFGLVCAFFGCQFLFNLLTSLSPKATLPVPTPAVVEGMPSATIALPSQFAELYATITALATLEVGNSSLNSTLAPSTPHFTDTPTRPVAATSTRAPAYTATRYYTNTPVIAPSIGTPPPTQSILKPAGLAALQATLDWSKAPDCDQQKLLVGLNLENAYALELSQGSTPALISIEPGLILVEDLDNGEIVARAELFPGAQLTPLALGAVEDAANYLVQVNHPLLDFEAILLQYQPSCERSQVNLIYSPAFGAREWLIQMLQTKVFLPPSDLQIDWHLVSWGPEPFSDRWIAELSLSAQGGNGSYVFFASGDVAGAAPGSNQMLTGNRVILQQSNCVDAVVRLGVTSGGHTAYRLLALHAPYCTSP